jgi:hypothetical protein
MVPAFGAGGLLRRQAFPSKLRLPETGAGGRRSLLNVGLTGRPLDAAFHPFRLAGADERSTNVMKQPRRRGLLAMAAGSARARRAGRAGRTQHFTTVHQVGSPTGPTTNVSNCPAPALAPRVPLRQRCFIKLPRQIGTACGPNGRASPLANQLDGYCSSYPRVEGKGETAWGTPSDPRNQF